MGQQLGDLMVFLRRQTRKHIFQIGIRIMPIELRRLYETKVSDYNFSASRSQNRSPTLFAQKGARHSTNAHDSEQTKVRSMFNE